MAAVQARWERAQPPKEPTSVIAAARRVIPAGACVFTDEVSLTIMANRFTSNVPGCPLLLDTTGTDLALAHGRIPATGAASSAPLVAVWRSSFGHAQYIWLSRLEKRRVPWTPALMAYFRDHFTLILSTGAGRTCTDEPGCSAGPAVAVQREPAAGSSNIGPQPRDRRPGVIVVAMADRKEVLEVAAAR